MSFPRTIPAEFVAPVALHAQYRRAGEDYAREHPDRSFTLGYECLVANPAGVLGERFEPEVLVLFHDAQRGQSLEDPKIGHTREIHRLSVGRWRDEPTSQETDITRAQLREWLEPVAEL